MPSMVPLPAGQLSRQAALEQSRQLLDADGLVEEDANIEIAPPRFRPRSRAAQPIPDPPPPRATTGTDESTAAVLATLLETNAALLAELAEMREVGHGASDEGGGGGRGEARYVRYKDAFLNDPEPEIRQYFATVQEEIGAEVSGTPWTIEQYGKEKVPFGSHTTLQRMFLVLAKIAHFHRTNRPRHALGMAVLGLQAVERAVRDDGAWAAAWPLTYLPDPRQAKGTAPQAKMATIGKMLSERDSLEQIIDKQKKGKDNHHGKGDRGGGKPSGGSA